jgi:hypothetical protein
MAHTEKTQIKMLQLLVKNGTKKKTEMGGLYFFSLKSTNRGLTSVFSRKSVTRIAASVWSNQVRGEKKVSVCSRRLYEPCDGGAPTILHSWWILPTRALPKPNHASPIWDRSLSWKVMIESIVRWFVMREKHCSLAEKKYGFTKRAARPWPGMARH